jgi:hypothetical protein
MIQDCTLVPVDFVTPTAGLFDQPASKLSEVCGVILGELDQLSTEGL